MYLNMLQYSNAVAYACVNAALPGCVSIIEYFF